MSKDQSKEIEEEQIIVSTLVTYPNMAGDHYGVYQYHGHTVSTMLIVMLLIFMAVLWTFMAIIMRNLRVPKLLLHLYMRTFNHTTE